MSLIERDLLPSEEFMAELRIPEERLEIILEDLLLRSVELSSAEFETYEEAALEREDFENLVNEHLATVENHKSIHLVIAGAGALIPNEVVMINENEELSDTVTVKLDRQTPLRSLAALEKAHVVLERVWCTITSADNKYSVRPYMTSKIIDERHEALKLQNIELNLVEVAISRRAIIDLASDSEITVLLLNDVRERKKVISAIALHGLSKSLFTKYLNKLNRALHTEDPTQFTRLTDLKIIHSIGTLGALESSKGIEQAKTVSDAIVYTFGRGAEVEIGYLESLPGMEDITMNVTLRCYIQDVLMPMSDADKIPPKLILLNKNEPNKSEVVSIRFDQITSLRF
jgi:hypothetical protein